MDNYCFVNGHIIREYSDLVTYIQTAINNEGGEIYECILDLIWQDKFYAFAAQLLCLNEANKLQDICKSIRERELGEFEGLKQIAALFHLKTNEISRMKYIVFSGQELSLIGNADWKDESHTELKRDNIWPMILVKTQCKIVSPIDEDFRFVVKIFDKSTSELYKDFSTPCYNPQDCYYNGDKEITIEIPLEELPIGDYIIELHDDITESTCVQRTELKVLPYEYKDCFELKSVKLIGESLFKHRQLDNVEFLIENSTEYINLVLENEIIKSINQDFQIEIYIGENLAESKPISTKDLYISTQIDVSKLCVGMYRISVCSANGHSVLNNQKCLYVTGGKRSVEVNENLRLRFVEIVDNNMHYMLAENILTNNEFNKIMNIKKEGDNMPCVFNDSEKNTAFEKANSFTDEVKRLFKKKHKDKYKIDRMSVDVWKHAVNNGNIITEEYDISDYAVCAKNSNLRLQPVKKMKCTLLGLYDILGNIYVLTRSSDNFSKLVLWNHCLVVGGDYSTASVDLKTPKHFYLGESGHSFGIRLMIELPPLKEEDQTEYKTMTESEEYNLYDSNCSSDDSTDWRTKLLENEMSAGCCGPGL